MTVIGSPRYSFLAKLFGAAALIGLADLFFYDHEPGWTLGGFALAWALVLAVTRPDVRHDRAARVALVVALLFGVMLVDDPGPLDWCVFGLALMSASLLPLRRFDDAIRWGLRIALHGIFGLATPFRDARRLVRRCPSRTLVTVSGLLILPVLGGALFLYLFAQANPLIAGTFAAIRFPDLSAAIFHAVFWVVVLLAVWPALRPHRVVLRFDFGGMANTARARHLSVTALILSLVTFNAIFAVQNALDLAFLWSGAPLPAGVTPAEYAHRGAYPLIVTALLAGTFVLLAARPDSDGARSPLVRRLILSWVAQNLLLVASSMLRTRDYIAASMLTGWRIAALLWMGRADPDHLADGDGPVGSLADQRQCARRRAGAGGRLRSRSGGDRRRLECPPCPARRRARPLLSRRAGPLGAVAADRSGAARGRAGAAGARPLPDRRGDGPARAGPAGLA